MADSPIAKYQFASWARKGLSVCIEEADTLGKGNGEIGTPRASISLKVSVDDKSSSFYNEVTVHQIGPGDILSIFQDMIVRTSPVPGVLSHDPNNLVLAEFYDEDFPWRYTPARAVGEKHEKLRPWLVLLVLKPSEFSETDKKYPLPSIKVKSPAGSLPPYDETWLWAHMHVTEETSAGTSELESFLSSLNAELATDPDRAYSRLLCPRKLEPGTPYTAFIVPAFESGRLAGLDEPNKTTPAQQPAWTSAAAEIEFPVYHSWSFATGEDEDFKTLVTQLVPRVVDSRVGIRDMDCSKPGFRKLNGTGEVDGTVPGILGLEGALKTADTISTVFPLVQKISIPRIIGFRGHESGAGKFGAPPSASKIAIADPGAFIRQVQELVNYPTIMMISDEDPIVSIPFYGQNHARQSETQKVLMDANSSAWYNELNRDPRFRVPASLGTSVVQSKADQFMQKAWMQVKSIIEANRIINEHKFVMTYSDQMTKKHLNELPDETLLAITANIHSKVVGEEKVTVQQQKTQSSLPNAVFDAAFRRLLRPKSAITKRSMNSVDYAGIVKSVNTKAITAAGEKTELIGLTRLQSNFLGKSKTIAGELKNFSKLDDLARAKPQPGFSLKLSRDNTLPTSSESTEKEVDSPEAAFFREALIGLYSRINVSMPLPENKPDFVMAKSYDAVSNAISPRTSFSKRLNATVRIPGFAFTAEKILPAMAYPDIAEPAYTHLRDLDKDLLIPNLDLIPTNTISLLQTNDKFIEAYMVGLNHEMGRQLLWNEYPTDQRGSYFRQFWDVNSVQRPENAASAETLKDIKPVHTWGTSVLGSHSNRTQQSQTVVLVINGELLTKYPNTVIYAQKATNNNKNEIATSQIGADDFKFPIFSARIDPGIRFLGFDLTVAEAKGGSGTSHPPGWFFILQEVAGDPKFGLEIKIDNEIPSPTWSDQSWEYLTSGTPFTFLTAGNVPTNTSKITDAHDHRWATSAAEMAYILSRRPHMVAVHASDMLPKS